MKTGELVAIDVPEWTYHPADDVAVAPVRVTDQFDCVTMAEKAFLDAWDRRPTLGDRVYFIGMLSLVSAMVDDNVPMVRSGTLGRTFQEDVPVEHPDGAITRHTFHLIDCRSYAGFSGSPCMVQFQAVRYQAEPTIPGGAIGNMIRTETVLLGLISAHLDDHVEIERTGELANDELLGSLRAPVFTGVGLVTPVEKLRETLMDEDLQKRRERHDSELLRVEEERKDEPVAAPVAPRPGAPHTERL
jgi:hypothetical protein